MTQIHPQLITFSVLLQQRIHDCLGFRCRALMVCMLQLVLRVTVENQALETLCQVDRTAPRRQFTAHMEI